MTETVELRSGYFILRRGHPLAIRVELVDVDVVFGDDHSLLRTQGQLYFGEPPLLNYIATGAHNHL